ncbi:MAG: response regulator [Proteobacteria bacterium]|nr:response regulator [Pseudomonadota bacterium]MBU1714809.1 response regulator [Pseudomonadota bacterium]
MGDIKILLVDDEEDFIRTLSERLELRDLAGQTALDGEQALQFVGDKEPDVMVLDLKMPGIDGMEVLRRIRQVYPHIQVIIQTGHGNDLDEAEARRLGVFDYLKKPVDIDLLVERIKAAYQVKRSSLLDSASAAAFAEAGEYDTAREIMKNEIP